MRYGKVWVGRDVSFGSELVVVGGRDVSFGSELVVVGRCRKQNPTE